jgi:hypothetical protein
MRKFLASIVVFMLFSMFSVSALAGKHQVCEEFKGYKRLFGLCNAYQNALAHEDEEAMADISDNWDKWVNEFGEPALPNRVVDTGDDGTGEEIPVVCPCWDFQTLVDAIQCDGFQYLGQRMDSTGEDSGIDSLSLLLPALDYWSDDETISVYAGNLLSDGTKQCRILADYYYTVSQLEELERAEEIQCRMDVVDLADVALAPGDCGTYPRTD